MTQTMAACGICLILLVLFPLSMSQRMVAVRYLGDRSTTFMLDRLLLGGKCYFAPPIEKQASSHPCILFSPISFNVSSSAPSPTFVRLFKNTDLLKAQFYLQYMQNGDHCNLFAEVSAKASVDEAAEFLLWEISESFHQSTPLSKVTVHKSGSLADSNIIKLVRQ